MYGFDDELLGRMAAALGTDLYGLVGRLVRLKEWAVANTTRGWGDGVTAEWIDWFIGMPGTSALLHEMRLIDLGETGVRFAVWQEEIGRLDDARAGSRERMTEWRARKKKFALDGFDGWWEIWPRKQAKCDAQKAWTKLAPDEALRRSILAATLSQITWEQWTKDGGKFIPLPASWLRGRRWEDEQTEAVGRQAATLDWMRNHGLE